VSSVRGVSARFRLQIRMFPRCEQSFGTPHVMFCPECSERGFGSTATDGALKRPGVAIAPHGARIMAAEDISSGSARS
jgi:hypothetical protein